LTVVEEEAASLREAADRFLTGESLRSICFDWNERGIKTSTGGDWSSTVLSDTLRRDRYAGIRVHKDKRWPATWEPIFDEATYVKLAAALSDSRRRVVRSEPRKYLLSGYVRCGHCDAPMHVLRRQEKGVTFVRWRCRRDPGSPGCGKVSVSYGSLDELVVARLLTAMAETNLTERDDRKEARAVGRRLERQIREDRAALRDLVHKRFIERGVTDKYYTEVQAKLEQQIQEAEAARSRLGSERTRLRIPRGRVEIEKWWSRVSLDVRRNALDTFIDYVAIDPAKTRGGNKFDASRVRFVWR
jgi:hypothetical protein